MEKKILYVDMDGTIVAPVFKTRNGTALGFPTERWIQFCNEAREAAYDHCLPMRPILERVEKMVANGYDARILTVALSEGERIGKKSWLQKNPGHARLFSEIIFLDHIEEKVPYIMGQLKLEGVKPLNCTVIDDHYQTVLAAIEAGINGLHISHLIAPV